MSAHQAPQAAREAAEVIDAAGVAGGARIDVGLLLDTLYGSLAGGVGRDRTRDDSQRRPEDHAQLAGERDADGADPAVGRRGGAARVMHGPEAV